jgi:nuclease S1
MPAGAWGDLGHNVTALVAYRHLLPQARAHLDALLASDTDPLTAPDFAARATWADKYRNAHRETAAWHFVDIEIDQPDLDGACFGFPPLEKGQAASQGPAQDCVANKIDEFTAELADPGTARTIKTKVAIASALRRRLTRRLICTPIGTSLSSTRWGLQQRR